MKNKNCKHINKDGESCNAYAINNSDYCFWHDPNKAIERNNAQLKGGLQGRRAVLEESNIKIENISDVLKLLEKTINQVRSGEIDSKIASVVGFLSNIMLRALEQGLIEKRVAAMENIIFTGDRNEKKY